MPLAHGRGTAAEQGAALRASIIVEQSRSSDSASQERRSSVACSRQDTSSYEQLASCSNPDISVPSMPVEERFCDADHGEPADTTGVKKESRPAEMEGKRPSQKTFLASVGASEGAGSNEKSHARPAGNLRRKTPFAMKRVETLTGIDNLTLLLEDEAYHPACFSIYMFETDIDRQTVEAFLEKLVELFPKYRYKVELDPSKAAKLDKQARKRLAAANGHVDVENAEAEKARRDRSEHPDPGRKTRYAKGLKAGAPFTPAKWRILDDFDIRENLEEQTCTAPNNSENALFDIAGRFLERHFNYQKPLWEALLVHGLETEDGSKAGLMIKIHHVLSDGQGLIQSYGVALAAIEHGLSSEDVQHRFELSPEVKKPGQRGVKPTVRGTVKHSAKTIRGLYLRSRKSFLYAPSSQEGRVYGRRYAHSRGIDMNDIKLIREAFSTDKEKLTLNDVACAVLSKSIAIAARRVAPDGKVRDKRIAIFVPISVRPKGNYELANMTTGAIAWFALDENMPLEGRLAQVNREMTRIKKSHLPKIWYKTLDFVCKRRLWYVPHYPIGKEFFEKAYREYSVATNVPGPPKPVKFGSHVANRYFVLPPSSPGKGTLAIGLISYAGSLSVSVSCDDVPEFATLAKGICASFQDGAADLIAAAKERLAARKEKAA
ncbi:hypothetical protein K437DRAFT_255489 [Tilletiaria anomala UBC 951]|uniref:Uncharacterized protein n=1 Tax=Tilletiaria anomala (strain ATCC 24038 / CBS 436.72 / UBC 951) TaxID=1037660 RepID=A0A066WCL2_TILAU|nr:uncharacterized protein K437DRAFT_255489 [Tilletiaria anomala UBC 951]KDN48515.1 hypothetical protein K437DRAFT_255489 [Tilletiaria anomala UBC 951]